MFFTNGHNSQKKNYLVKGDVDIDLIKKFNIYDVNLYNFAKENIFKLSKINKKERKNNIYLLFNNDVKIREKSITFIDNDIFIKIYNFLKSNKKDIIE